MKNFIKANMNTIITLLNTYEAIRQANAKIGVKLAAINGKFNTGIMIRSRDRENDVVISRGTNNVQLVQDCTSPAEMEKIEQLLKALVDDEELFDVIRTADIGYDDKFSWTITETTRDYDFSEMTDAEHVEYKLKLNPATGRISQSKPHTYYSSVLAALNID